MNIPRPIGGTDPREVVTLDDTVLDGITFVEERGAWNAPEEDTERGFAWASYVGRESLEIDIEAWIEREDYDTIQGLREQDRPFSASAGHIFIDKAKLDSVSVEDEGYDNRLFVSIAISEIREAEVDTVTTREPAGRVVTSRSDMSREERNLLAGGGDASNLAEETGGVMDTIQDGIKSIAEVATITAPTPR